MRLMGLLLLIPSIVNGQALPMTLDDFHLSGTQIGDVSDGAISTSSNCAGCHGYFDTVNEPYATWTGSLMAQAGRDPLFYAQMTLANQDAANAGYFCMRCHVPMSFVTGHANDASGNSLDDMDRDGVTCHFCHSMVDPVYKPGISPVQDVPVLNALAAVPQFYGNSMFVLDPSGLRRGPYTNATPPHTFVASPFHRTGDLCGTCHDVGNVAVSRQPNGTYRYNNLNQATPNEDLAEQFPLERTYTEWKLSAFANGGVDMGGRFGGTGPTVVSTCQDCHMPKATAQGCFFGPTRNDLARHDFAGASAWVLEIIGLHFAEDPGVDLNALQAARAKAISMVQRAASLQLVQSCGSIRARVINESGHKIPTGHIEGRRIWVNVKFLGANDVLLREYGHYDTVTAELDEASTTVYEMRVGLSQYAAGVTGYPAGATTHMALADTIVKDTRIPPRGFDNATYSAAGAPAVGIDYADGQYWDDTYFWAPDHTTKVVVSVAYQTVTKHYIEALRDGNVTDNWGQVLYQLWLDTNRCAPIEIVSGELLLTPFVRGDANADGMVNLTDHSHLLNCLTGPADSAPDACACMDFDGDGHVDMRDVMGFQSALGDQ